MGGEGFAYNGVHGVGAGAVEVEGRDAVVELDEPEGGPPEEGFSGVGGARRGREAEVASGGGTGVLVGANSRSSSAAE